jgi:hypothetical protein
VTRLVQADRQINLFEFVLQRVLLKHLDHVFGRSKPPAVRYHSVSAVMRQVVTLLSTLVHLGRVTGDEAQRAFDQAMSVVADDTAMQLLPKESCSLSEIGAAIDKLAECSPPIKKRVLTGATTCVVADGKITSGEAEMLRAVADSLNCPMPPVLGAQSTICTAV